MYKGVLKVRVVNLYANAGFKASYKSITKIRGHEIMVFLSRSERKLSISAERKLVLMLRSNSKTT